jgi:hypothetical protein
MFLVHKCLKGANTQPILSTPILSARNRKAIATMKPAAALFVVSLASAAHGWKVGDSSTGSTDPDVTTKCTQWANDISSKDSCKALQKEFDIDFQQLHEWVRICLCSENL